MLVLLDKLVQRLNSADYFCNGDGSAFYNCQDTKELILKNKHNHVGSRLTEVKHERKADIIVQPMFKIYIHGFSYTKPPFAIYEN